MLDFVEGGKLTTQSKTLGAIWEATRSLTYIQYSTSAPGQNQIPATPALRNISPPCLAISRNNITLFCLEVQIKKIFLAGESQLLFCWDQENMTANLISVWRFTKARSSKFYFGLIQIRAINLMQTTVEPLVAPTTVCTCKQVPLLSNKFSKNTKSFQVKTL